MASSAVAGIWRDGHRRAGGTAHAEDTPLTTGGTKLNHAIPRLYAKRPRGLRGLWSKRHAKHSPRLRNSPKRGIREVLIKEIYWEIFSPTPK